MIKWKTSTYLRFTKTILRILKKARIPKRFSKFSKKIFNNWQHFVLQIFRQHERKSYREFIEWLNFSKLQEALSLKRIPHFTTLQKFAVRIGTAFLQKLISTCVQFLNAKKFCIGVDATGFTLNCGSKHYCRRVKTTFRGFPGWL